MAISADGRFFLCQLRVLDRATGVWKTAPAPPAPQSAPAVPPTENPVDVPDRISGDDRYVVYEFAAATPARGDIYRWNTLTGVTLQIDVPFDSSPTTGWALRPDLSRDGTVVSFDSDAANIVAGDSNAAADVFVRVVGP